MAIRRPDDPGYRNISAWAIRNPIPTVVLFLLLTLGGLFAFPGLRVNNTPDIDLPAVLVTILQPGAAPSELETQVTRRVEEDAERRARLVLVLGRAHEGEGLDDSEMPVDFPCDGEPLREPRVSGGRVTQLFERHAQVSKGLH